MKMDEIKVGDRVRSFDLSDQETVGPRACFIEGTVTGIGRFPQFDDCDRYEIRVEREMFGGEECDVSEPEFRYPPVNGTRVAGRAQEVTDGVVLLKSAESHSPLPWYTAKTGNHQGLVVSEKTGDNIAVTYSGDGDAEFIVKACNCHDELLAACRAITCEEANSDINDYHAWICLTRAEFNEIKSAIAKCR